MNAELKAAWYSVLVIGCTVLCWAIMQAAVGFPKSMAAFALMGFLGLAPALFPRATGGASLDERDVAIVRRATLVGAMASYLVVVVMAMIVWAAAFFRGKHMVDLHWLGALVWTAGITLWFVRALCIISQYPRMRRES